MCVLCVCVLCVCDTLIYPQCNRSINQDTSPTRPLSPGPQSVRILCFPFKLLKASSLSPPSDTLHILESEAKLLFQISHHKSIISPPNLHAINFSEERHQRFYYSTPQPKQALLRQLFGVGEAIQAYVYPLYGVTMATKIKVGGV